MSSTPGALQQSVTTLYASDPSQWCILPADHERVTTLTRLLAVDTAAACSCGHAPMALWWVGESRTRGSRAVLAGRAPRDRGGPGEKEAGRHASSGPEMARLGARAAPHYVAAGVTMKTGPERASLRTCRGIEIAAGSHRGSARSRGGLLLWR